jgi:hypothetical protein
MVLFTAFSHTLTVHSFFLPTQQPYSIEQNNVRGAEFGLTYSNEKWFNPLDSHGTHVTVSVVWLVGNSMYY